MEKMCEAFPPTLLIAFTVPAELPPVEINPHYRDLLFLINFSLNLIVFSVIFSFSPNIDHCSFSLSAIQAACGMPAVAVPAITSNFFTDNIILIR